MMQSTEKTRRTSWFGSLFKKKKQTAETQGVADGSISNAPSEMLEGHLPVDASYTRNGSLTTVPQSTNQLVYEPSQKAYSIVDKQSIESGSVYKAIPSVSHQPIAVSPTTKAPESLSQSFRSMRSFKTDEAVRHFDCRESVLSTFSAVPAVQVPLETEDRESTVYVRADTRTALGAECNKSVNSDNMSIASHQLGLSADGPSTHATRLDNASTRAVYASSISSRAPQPDILSIYTFAQSERSVDTTSILSTKVSKP